MPLHFNTFWGVVKTSYFKFQISIFGGMALGVLYSIIIHDCLSLLYHVNKDCNFDLVEAGIEPGAAG